MKTEIDAKTVKKLRDETGAGMMTCKQALTENHGDYDKAIESLRLKGMATADKKSSRNTNEGLIYSYIHTGSKLGILLEINCETDFVARREEFTDLAKNISMQIASNPEIQVVSLDDISDLTKIEVRKFENAKDDLQNKPEEIKNKIVEGRVEKSLKKQVLLEQEYIRDPNITVTEYIKQVVSILGENIRVQRFTRYVLGEID
jgi:elongation factor Ts|uniref:Elongation factor Ts, chloroplastic n=2 Tax=Phaeodactylum tricornutum TaxID=2850 RepID=EFTS_PHATC|nr:elongation factor Ts [Phaeodactylum tricornutum]Q9TK50.1 RecName: Full=Elongation factor Ts, chloroplastic; Short=EF-Ts [Phaeodactylum tricornutum CCAP 1055/1]AAF07202.1 elongation factor Ts [Phaeodactylum tricornutum]AAV69749.1 elongation factor Ts [Phaeodactylum tricornutum]ABK20639.1 elongation factor Ts [Phaeodactylum tricornutum]QHR85593.1 elongation factor Ts [Phaeodactylum tricornutum]